jgi:hypothetical protein
LVAHFIISIYGGYFGGGISGFLMLAALTLFGTAGSGPIGILTLKNRVLSPAASGFAISRMQAMNSCAAGLSVRFFSVTMPTGPVRLRGHWGSRPTIGKSRPRRDLTHCGH